MPGATDTFVNTHGACPPAMPGNDSASPHLVACVRVTAGSTLTDETTPKLFAHHGTMHVDESAKKASSAGGVGSMLRTGVAVHIPAPRHAAETLSAIVSGPGFETSAYEHA